MNSQSNTKAVQNVRLERLRTDLGQSNARTVQNFRLQQEMVVLRPT